MAVRVEGLVFAGVGSADHGRGFELLDRSA
jgi:hypothetical protein